MKAPVFYYLILYMLAVLGSLTANWVVVNQAFKDVSQIKYPKLPDITSEY